MPIANPLTNATAGTLAPGHVGSGGGSSPQGSPAAAVPTGGADASGIGRFMGSIDRTPLHVGTLVLGGLVVIVLLHLGGFRFVFSAGGGR